MSPRPRLPLQRRNRSLPERLRRTAPVRSLRARRFAPRQAARCKAAATRPRLNVLVRPFTAPPATLNIVSRELAEAGRQTRVTDIPLDRGPVTPFAISTLDFAAGNARAPPGERHDGPPIIDAASAKWFDDIVARGKKPDIFVIGGHDVISEGWHNDAETGFLYLPTLRETVATHPNAQKVFGNVKLAILWGCNTMTNLEPHGANGAYLSPEDIAAQYAQGGSARQKMVGTPNQTNTLEFYKSRLAREYGPGMEHYEYTRKAKNEVCKAQANHEGCTITNVDRAMPDSGLLTARTASTGPAMMKELFPERVPRARLLERLTQRAAARRHLRRGFCAARSATSRGLLGSSNIIQQIIDPATPEPLRATIIEAVRRNWTRVTYEANRHRPSGSITPKLPQLDANGIFNVNVSKDTPMYAPYEQR